MSAQNRTAPAYQEYAANMIARLEYRSMTLPQRGLLYSMRLECWVNQFLPESPSVLARILGFDVAEVAAELPYVMQFFACENGRIFAPDLEAYRMRVEHIRERQAQGGKVGAAKTNARKVRPDAGASADSGNSPSNPAGNSSGKPRAPRRVSVESFNPNPSPSPSQEGGYEPTTSIGDIEGWGDFTADPDEEGGAA